MVEREDWAERSAAFGSGRISAPVRLLLDTHAALNPEAQADAAIADAVGGALLERLAPEPMSEGALDAALAAIDAEPDHGRQAAAARAAGAALDELIVLPEPLRSAALAAAGRGGWRFAGPGIRAMDLVRQGAARAELLRIQPGCGAPEHDHQGEEYTLVVEGAFSDGHALYRRGDLCVARPGFIHRPVAEPGAVCFALAITDAPAAFTGALGLVQRLFRLN